MIKCSNCGCENIIIFTEMEFICKLYNGYKWQDKYHGWIKAKCPECESFTSGYKDIVVDEDYFVHPRPTEQPNFLDRK